MPSQITRVTTDANLLTSDITTNNASTSKHGFAPKYPNDATKFLDGTGAYSVPTSAAHAIYVAASPPTTDVGIFTIVITGINLKAAGTSDIFTIPTSRTFLAVNAFAFVTAVTSGGAGTQSFSIIESGGSRTMLAALASGSGTPVVNQTVYTCDVRSSSAPFSVCAAAAKVQITVQTSHAGSSAVTGSVFVTGYYVT